MSNRIFARHARRNSAASTDGAAASSTSCPSSSSLRSRARAASIIYARYRYDEIPKIHSKHLVKQIAAPGKPFNVLLVGDDSRAFVNNPTQVKAFGDEANAGGQRSDVTMVARFVPATKSVTVISIPRDLWVDIPPNSSDIQGMNRINAAFNSGPDLLIQTIESVLHIPINHYISVGFPGFLGMVDALGGRHDGLPHRRQGRLYRTERHHAGLPGDQRDDVAPARAGPAPRIREQQRSLGVRRAFGLQPHPAAGFLLPRRAGQGQHVDHQPTGDQRLHLRRPWATSRSTTPSARATCSTSQRSSGVCSPHTC